MMEDFLKIVGAGVIIWLLFGGKGVLEKKPKSSHKDKSTTAARADTVSRQPELSRQTAPSSRYSEEALLSIPNRPPFEIQSLAYLQSLDRDPLTVEQVKVTYYLRDNSQRCHFDSLPPCLQDRLVEHELNKRDFQFTYFFDRVLDSGSGVLTWEMRDFFVQYESLRKYGWTSGKRNFSNDYNCNSFSYRSKKGVEFIQDNLLNRELFLPLETLRYPNGQTASGEPAVDWQTLAVNLTDFPLSVPNSKRRESWTKRAAANGKRPPHARVFIVLEFPNGKKYLTEASDTGSGVKTNSVDWRIGNTSDEIALFHALGNKAKATAFVIDDEKVTFAQVLAQSK
ncbi:hypothetical protein HUU05_01880 [candidate division KSB1 bacterium]|nr:hypothetical protein [candidate division KSB1 bacterium]